jgi:hypothetical protein
MLVLRPSHPFAHENADLRSLLFSCDKNGSSAFFGALGDGRLQ